MGDVPAAVTTRTSTVPTAWEGAVTVSLVADSTVTPAPAVVPKRTVLAPVKLVPLTVTLVPPVELPDVGDTAVTDGSVAASATTGRATPPVITRPTPSRVIRARDSARFKRTLRGRRHKVRRPALTQIIRSHRVTERQQA